MVSLAMLPSLMEMNTWLLLLSGWLSFVHITVGWGIPPTTHSNWSPPPTGMMLLSGLTAKLLIVGEAAWEVRYQLDKSRKLKSVNHRDIALLTAEYQRGRCWGEEFLRSTHGGLTGVPAFISQLHIGDLYLGTKKSC